MSVVQITLNSTEDLVFYPPDDHAPSSATLTLKDVNGGELAGTWPATVNRDNVNTTLTAQASQAARMLTLDVITNIIPDTTYILAIPDGRRFRVKVVGVNPSTKQVYLDQPITATAASGSLFVGLAYRYAMTAPATAAVLRRCSALWSYAINGKTVQEKQRFDIVRDPWELRITESDVEEYDHVFGETAGSSNRWQSLIPGVSADIMRRLESRKIYADLIKDRDMLKRAGCLLLLSRFYGARPGDDSQKLSDKWMKQFDSAYISLLDADMWYDVNDNDRLGQSTNGAVPTIDSSENEPRKELGLPGYYTLVG